jgi:hypothetical protein
MGEKPPSAGGKNWHCRSPVSPDIEAARERAETNEQMTA